MIRVNLLRNRVADTAIQSPSASSETSNEAREALVKVAFVLLFTLGLMMFESQNIRSLNEELIRVQASVSDLEVQSQAKATEVEAIKDVAQQAKELEDKLKVLKLLSKLRLREVKTLDFMQSSIPEKVWLREVKYDSSKENVEMGRFEFNGNSVTTEDLSEFVKRLEDSAYLNEVIIIKNQEATGTTRSGSLRDFFFTAEVEAKN